MKNLILMLAMCLGVIACSNSNSTNDKATEEESKKDCVEVLYFHGKQRCATCMTIEKNAKEVLETQFAEELKNGTVVFKSIDISKDENEKIAAKYEVTWSSLIISRWKDGKESHENLTEFAFANARTASYTFKSGVADKIRILLK